MKEKTASFSGHRNISTEDLNALPQRLDRIIAALINLDIVFFESGCALGFDTLAAQAVLRARKMNREIKLIAVLPCINQSEKWPEADKKVYQQLLSAADNVVYVSNLFYDKDCMKQRNLYLATNSSICVAYMKRKRSGTAQTVRMAKKQGALVLNLAE